MIQFSTLIWRSPEIQCLKVQLLIQQMKSIEIVAFSCLFLLIKFLFSIDDSCHVHNNVKLCWKSRNLPYFQSHPQFDENGNFVPLQNLQNQARGPSRQIQYCCNPRIKIGKIVEIIKGRFLGKIGKVGIFGRSLNWVVLYQFLFLFYGSSRTKYTNSVEIFFCLQIWHIPHKHVAMGILMCHYKTDLLKKFLNILVLLK